jgi:Family of unknown function (DUF6328)
MVAGDEPEDTPSAEVEEEQTRLNRQLTELMTEARVAMPGVQVLFGFLLAVPFQQRFGDTTSFQRHLYLATVLLAAMSTMCFIAPAAFHRIRFEQRDKPYLIAIGTRFLIAGFGSLALAMTCAIALVCDVIFGTATTLIVVVPVVLAFLWLWFGLGLTRRALGKRSH